MNNAVVFQYLLRKDDFFCIYEWGRGHTSYVCSNVDFRIDRYASVDRVRTIKENCVCL